MPKVRTIQWKAFLMLFVFTVNFTVICHCASNAVPRAPQCHACCEKHSQKQSGHKGCSGMQAVKFNLLEKQVSADITSGELPVILVNHNYFAIAVVLLPVNSNRRFADQWGHKHAPPDLQVLYRTFLI